MCDEREFDLLLKPTSYAAQSNGDACHNGSAEEEGIITVISSTDAAATRAAAAEAEKSGDVEVVWPSCTTAMTHCMACKHRVPRHSIIQPVYSLERTHHQSFAAPCLLLALDAPRSFGARRRLPLDD